MAILQGHTTALILVVFLLASYIIIFFQHHIKIQKTAPLIALGVTGAAFVMALRLSGKVMTEGSIIYAFGGWSAPRGIEFEVSFFSILFLLMITGVSFLILLYAGVMLKFEVKDRVIPLYYALFLVLVGSLVGAVLSNDLFNIFVFMEIGAIAGAALIAINGDRRAIEGALKYLILSTLGSGCMLMAIAFIYMITGNLNLGYVAAVMPEMMALYPRTALGAFSLLMVGLGVKAALYPLHVWLPDAYTYAPSPTSALLGGLVGKVYIAVMLKLIFNVFSTDVFSMVPLRPAFLIVSSLGILMGSIFAMFQKDLKRMLAYSSIAQIGYIFLGIALLTPAALVGALLHIFNHAVIKAMLFLVAGSLDHYTGTRRIPQLRGVGSRHPLAATIFGIGSLAMVGMPLFNGFISKWYLSIGAVQAGEPLYVLIILVSSLLSAFYYFPIVIGAFLRESKHYPHVKMDWPVTVSLVVLGFAAVFFGVFPSGAVRIAEKAAFVFLGM